MNRIFNWVLALGILGAVGLGLDGSRPAWGQTAFSTSLAGSPVLALAEGIPLQSDPYDFSSDFGSGGPEDVPPAFLGVMLAIIVIAVLIGLAIQAVICWLLTSWLAVVPEQYRTMEPWQVWLLFIPCFNIVWNFFVYQRIPQSYQNYFHAQGRTDQGDCGAQLGLWYAICVAASIIPIVNYIAGPASFVLLIIFLVKLYQHKTIAASSGMMPPAPYGG